MARELELDRKTVRRHFRLNQATKSPISTPGSGLGRKSHCEAVAVQTQAALEVGLSTQRIYQDLVTERQFTGSYESVNRFVRRLGAVTPLPFRRMECAPAQQVQVDGNRKRPHLFHVVLSHSRKAYSEVVWRQTTENFIRCLENVFRHFGGVPQTVVTDNLKAAVIKTDWFAPELNPKIVSFPSITRPPSCPPSPATPAQGQGRGGGEVCPEQRARGPYLQQPGRAEHVPCGVGARGGGHADPRHDAPAGQPCLHHGGAGVAGPVAGHGLPGLQRSAAHRHRTGMWRWTRCDTPCCPNT